MYCNSVWDTRWRSWLRRWATNRKVVGSIPDRVIGILTYSFRPHYGPSFDTPSNRNEYQKYFLGGKSGRCYGWQPYHFHVPITLKSGSLNLLEPSGTAQVCNGIALPFIVILLYIFITSSFVIDDFLIITHQIHLVTLWNEVEYGPSSVLQIVDCPGTPISVTVCDFGLLWQTLREIRMELILAGSGV